jgi:hypothetical protein
VATLVADGVPAAPVAALVSLGFALVTTGSTVDTHLPLEVGCGAAVFPDAVVRAWLVCPAPDATVAVDGVRVPPVAAGVPLPSVPALARGEPPPPLSEEPAWRIA